MTTRPTDNPHVCKLCGKKIRKNNESFRDAISIEMTAAIRRDHPDFGVKDDICKECGQRYRDAVPARSRIPAWMKRPLG